MGQRLSLYGLMRRHALESGAARRLQALAGLEDPPAPLAHVLPRGLAVLAATLGGFGLILWIAANWEDFGRFGRFGLLLGFFVAMGGGAAARPALRAPLGLLALLAIGAVFAYFGQTYQTGADPWQLFAVWALLALPLCLGTRSDVLWAPWSLVAMAAVSLWAHARLGQRWQVQPEDLSTHAIAWLAGALLVLALGRLARRFTGAGVWSLRTAVTLWVVMLGFSALGGLFHTPVAPHFVLGLGVMAAAAVALSLKATFDVFALSAVALGLNVLVTTGLARWLFDTHRGDGVGRLLLIGCMAATLLAGSVHLILRLSRRHETTGSAA